jgi:predicted DNA-binding protein YlxM (UPF0122 family)
MRTPVIVDTPYPTVWETAKKMGVSKKRTLELIKKANEFLARREEKRNVGQAVVRKKRMKTASDASRRA